MRIFSYSYIIMATTLFFAGNAYSGEPDSYYLQQFGEASKSAETLLKSSTSDSFSKCGMPLRKGLRSDWSKLESSTQKTLEKYLVKPVLAREQTYNSPHFAIHYATAGVDAPPMATTSQNTAPDWVIAVSETFEYVYNKEVREFGFETPTAPALYPVYLQQLATESIYGYTDLDYLSGQSASSYIAIDNDFADSIYYPFNYLPGLQITAAHEFHHAIQFFYNYYFEVWYAEATSTWMEDEVYDSVDQLYGYSTEYLQSPSRSLDNPGDGGYGRWIFNRLLAEDQSAATIRSIWENLRRTTTTNYRDIPMLPVIDNTLKELQSSLAAEFTSFAKRLYARDWTTHTNELALLYSVPLKIDATYSSYPVNQVSFSSSTTSLPHYAMKYFKFVPSPATPDLTITINSTNGIQTALFRKTTTNITEITADSGGTSTSYTYAVNGFGTLDPSSDEVVLMVANTTSIDNHMVYFSTDGSTGQVTEPTTPSHQKGIGIIGSGGGGGCFIATAAYGSYLHPKVMILREFRDCCLLTNLPGRLLVAVYYKISPSLASFIASHETLRFVVRLCLAPLIFSVEHRWQALAAFVCCTATVLLLAIRRIKRELFNPQRI